MVERRLEWEALRNGRDLGGLSVGAGRETRFASIVRSDTLRQLTPVGWSALADYGVKTVLDLRFQSEIHANEPLDAGPGGFSREIARPRPESDGRPPWLRTVAVSILGEPDRACVRRFDRISRAEADPASSTRAVYLEMLAVFRPQFGAAAGVIADAGEGGVLVHCHAGKDRTGLVVALLLAVAGVAPEIIAADYALSESNLAASLAAWIAGGEDEADREHRSRVGASPEQAMVDVLEVIDDRYGGAAAYLLAAGLADDQLERVRNRLVA